MVGADDDVEADRAEGDASASGGVAAGGVAAGRPAADEVLDFLRAEIGRLLGGAIEPEEIERTSRFGDDLELESIELVALSERVTLRYGPRVDFAAWLSSMELDRILALTVGDLVDHVVASRRAGADRTDGTP